MNGLLFLLLLIGLFAVGKLKYRPTWCTAWRLQDELLRDES